MVNFKKHWNQGHKDEAWVIDTMKRLGYPVEKTSKRLDIAGCDAVCDTSRLSIKCPRAAERTGNLSFELMVYNGHTSTWEPGNWYRECVDYCLFKVGPTVYIATKSVLKTYIEELCNTYRTRGTRGEHEGVAWRFTKLSPQTRQSQIKAGHSHTDAHNLLLNLEDMIKLGLLTKLF